MSKKNPHTFTNDDGMITHKRFPRQAKTRREIERIQAMKPKIQPNKKDIQAFQDILATAQTQPPLGGDHA